ncbi:MULTISPECIES: SpoIIE family protein phosphatase [Staphylococcus]|uniref:Sigma-B regulation protein RsbU (Phosphoserine phosphatase) n=1 Tax=Staphylococcus pasteuri TaxID=45972 RepID=A0ABY1H9D3_9STAP|nr:MULTISPECIES: PP2C family protein-serine/threonine phosphatase [Staphylococcus]RQX26367.1 serine/threonine protein phosphatase [Staphylococcus warneri]KKI56527.1 Serine phosphatase RsbU, regulator of sigma subunit [Staphylococcus pasteuri]MBM6507806.1 PP2C family protein-serine/threonine phosphatase [Staphylococcus pasteuri]MCD9067625.1 PP2C family protein-serine/threonine phosphatase [Staphylococcus pasteuri]MCF7600673.1 PP2C family protein-serine/threonine phosphatase [Staphylococcus past
MEEFKKDYKKLIDESLSTNNKTQLIKKCEEFTNEVIKKDILPEDIVEIHKNYISSLDIAEHEALNTLDVLQEVVKGFGYSYRDYQKLVNKLQYHDKEIDLASRLQQTMLKTDIPQFDSIQIGVISVAAQKVSGDYFNLIDHNDGTMSFAVADVIGKGIPAALAMSMIKFGMDSYGHSQLPSEGLKRLNRVVEKNVNQNMFVTMFYGLYEEMNHLLYCSSAGHEPGYVYRAETEEFQEIEVRGRVLGISQQTRYSQQEIPIYIDDLVIILTDGVTEARNKEGEFIKKETLLNLIKKYKHMHPQDIVQIIYEAILKVQNPHKKDDMTILIIKRVN